MAEKNSPVIFSVEGLRFSIGSQQIFDDAELTVHEGEKIGLIGRNGCGKSTFLKLIAAPDVPPESGRIMRRRDIRTGFLPQDFTLESTLDVLGNVRKGVEDIIALLKEYENPGVSAHRHHELEAEIHRRDAWNYENRITMVMEALKTPPGHFPVDQLSGGEKRRVLLARELVGSPDLLLLDEPTNHLDAGTIEWLEEFLAAFRGTAVIVTHDRCFLDRVSTGIVEMSRGKFYSYDGNYSDFLVGKADREMHEDKQEEKRRKFLRSEIEWVRSNPKARTVRNQGRLRRFFEVSSVQAPPREEFMELVIPPAFQLGNKVIELADVTLGFGQKTLLRDFSFEFEPGMRLGVIGKNGTGKTSFLKLLTGELAPDAGHVEVADNVVFNYIDQGREELDDTRTVLEEIGEGGDYVRLGDEKITVWTYLRRFLFADERIRTRVEHLSGGERARLMLAKQLKRGGNFIILDEPTNDLDLATLRILEEALACYRGCVVAVSHDRFFLNRICTAILAFDEQGNPEFSPGDYDYYHEKKALSAAAAPATAISAAAPPAAQSGDTRRVKTDSGRRRLSYREQKELDGIEELIMRVETGIAELENLFGSAEFFREHGHRAGELQQRLAGFKTEQEELYRRWEKLEALRSE